MVMADWSRVGQGGIIIEDGTVKVKCKDVQEARAGGGSGILQLRWEAEVLEADNEEYIGKTLVQYTPIEDKEGGDTALWRTLSMVHACGIETDNLPNMDTEGAAFKKVYSACKGREMYWCLVKTQYNGKDKNEFTKNGMLRVEGNDVIEVDVDAVDDGDCPY